MLPGPQSGLREPSKEHQRPNFQRSLPRKGKMGRWGRGVGIEGGAPRRGCALLTHAPCPSPRLRPYSSPAALTAHRSPGAPGTAAATSGGSGSRPLGSRKRESGSDRGVERGRGRSRAEGGAL